MATRGMDSGATWMRLLRSASLLHQNGKLVLTSDRGRVFEVDTRTRSVRRVNLKKPNQRVETDRRPGSLFSLGRQ